ncbi:MAG: hypothetical protein ABIQ30_08010 [Devosia sp.]
MDSTNIASRRSILKGLGLAGMAGMIPFAAKAEAPALTAEQRRDFHMAEFKKACEELDPMIGHWSRFYADDDDGRITLHAFKLTGRYEGDGIYESGKVNALGNRGRWSVKLRAGLVIDDHRCFAVSCPGERMTLTEPALETFIGRKLEGV